MKFRTAATIITEIAIVMAIGCSCAPKDEEAKSYSAEPSIVDQSANPAELALVVTAHAALGRNSNLGKELVFRNDTISDSNGSKFVCGEFSNSANPTVYRQYIYSLQETMIFDNPGSQKWLDQCAHGWTPGHGPQQ